MVASAVRGTTIPVQFEGATRWWSLWKLRSLLPQFI